MTAKVRFEQGEVKNYELVGEANPNGTRPPRDSWPEPLTAPAFHGLAGEFVQMIEPIDESDPAALLAQLLAAFGNAAGRSAHVAVAGNRHGAALYTAIVAETAKGRKGTSWGRVRQLLNFTDRIWLEDRVVGGLSSGEGLIVPIRDPVAKAIAIKENGKPTGEFEDVVDDPGVEDKRLLAQEGELAQALRVMRREGNTLSAVIRQLWDEGRAAGLTKNSPTKTTNAHVSIIGHITRDEVRRELTAVDQGNGFANRFIWICARRSKLLPFPGQLDEAEANGLAIKFYRAVEFAQSAGEMQFDEAARERWIEVYPKLSEDRVGLIGAITARAEAQTVRLSIIYALLDQSERIELPHLEAALAVWRYADDSARFIFGDATGDPDADKILSAFKVAGEHGLSRTEIRDLFQRNKPGDEIDAALSVLATKRLARMTAEGRTTRWFAS
jgi:hypothetical protein